MTNETLNQKPKGSRNRPNPTLLAQIVGREIKLHLDPHDRTQRMLADEVGISESQVSRILKGTRHMTLDEFVLMAQAVGVRPSSLLLRALNELEKSQDDPETDDVVS